MGSPNRWACQTQGLYRVHHGLYNFLGDYRKNLTGLRSTSAPKPVNHGDVYNLTEKGREEKNVILIFLEKQSIKFIFTLLVYRHMQTVDFSVYHYFLIL